MNPRPTHHPATLLSALLAAVLLLTLVAAPPAADAKSSSSYRVTGRSASTSWTQLDGTAVGTTPFGNTHVGWLSADETSRGRAAVFGWIDDYDCEPGQTPGHGGHGTEVPAEEPEPIGCAYMGSRFIEGFDIPFTMDKKLNRATLEGRLTVYGGGHGEGGVVGQPQANIVWSGVGTTSRYRYTSYWEEGTTVYRESYDSTGREATMGGTLGPMGFDPDLSGGWLGTYKASGRTRTR